MDLKVLAGNVKRIRSACGVSQSALAEKSGISLPAIKKIEAAGVQARFSTLQSIAVALDVKVQEFFLPVPTMTSVRFRAKKTVKGRDQILMHVHRWLGDFAFLEKILREDVSFKFSEVMEKTRQKHSPVELAQAARTVLGLKNDEPIHDICGLLEHAGIKVLPYTYASDSFFGLSVGAVDKGPAIVVNDWNPLPTERQIFSAAHELGHLLMHMSSFAAAEEEENEQEEREADVFAGHFLMPDTGFKREWNDTTGLLFVDRVMKVKKIFRVSYKTVIRRLLDLKAVDANVWQHFQVAYRNRFNKKLAFKEEPCSEGVEPFGLDRFDFYEDRLSRLVRKAIDSGKISLSRGAEILRVSLGEMQELVGAAEVLV